MMYITLDELHSDDWWLGVILACIGCLLLTLAVIQWRAARRTAARPVDLEQAGANSEQQQGAATPTAREIGPDVQDYAARYPFPLWVAILPLAIGGMILGEEFIFRSWVSSLRATGQHVTAVVERDLIVVNSDDEIKGSLLVVNWTDPRTGHVHRFESETRAEMPCPMQRWPGAPILVVLDPTDPDRLHHVEVDACGAAGH